MKKLREWIEIWVNGGHVIGINITSITFWELVRIYNAIYNKEKPEFIMQDVKNILDRCHIKTIEYGIGWKVA